MVERHIWYVLDTATRLPLSPPYYSGGAAIRLARRLRAEGREVVVTRDDRDYHWDD